MRSAVLFTVLSAALLAGCASGTSADRARSAETALIGLPEADLLACAGQPVRSGRYGDGSVFWLYQRGIVGSDRGAGDGGRSASDGIGGDPFAVLRGGGGGAGSRGSSNFCEITVRLAGGVVTKLDTRTNSSWFDNGMAECDAIIGACVASVAPE